MQTLFLTFIFTLSVAKVTIDERFYVQDYKYKQNFIDTTKTFDIYLVKYSWHVGILFKIDSVSQSLFPFVTKGMEGNYIDIGWGDEEFYQSEDVDYTLGAKAILWPTSSVVRTGIYFSNIDDIVRYSDFCIKISATNSQLKKISEYINNSFDKIDTGGLVITSTKSNGKVVFYKSVLKYHLFHTCNTWVAEVLEAGGFEIEPSDIITANELFHEASNIGEVLKYEEN